MVVSNMKLNVVRQFCKISNNIKPKVCIVGSGPAGFYAAQHIIKKIPSTNVDIYEKLPVPFGLVRYGVAPDHPEVKNVINTFTKTAENPNVKFIGNVELGRNVTLRQLQEAYHAVLLTYGADENKTLNIPGESLRNIIPARRIVGWYNGTPWDKDLQIDLSGESVAIFGQGNVAIDVARILLTPLNDLRKTDITEHSLQQLASSKIKRIYLIGRRGPLQAAFTIKELREMLKLSNCCTIWNKDDFSGLSDVVGNLQRPKKRIMELMLKSAEENVKAEAKEFVPKFFRSPIEFIGDDSKVKKVKLCINRLQGDDILHQSAVRTDVTECLDCDLAITSIGYKSLRVDPDIPFDIEGGIVHNRNGKIVDDLFATGWLATGPVGVILTTMSNAFTTADLLCNNLEIVKDNKIGFDYIEKILREGNVQTVHWKDWLKIDEYEKREGSKLEKPREKLVSIKKMLEIAS